MEIGNNVAPIHLSVDDGFDGLCCSVSFHFSRKGKMALTAERCVMVRRVLRIVNNSPTSMVESRKAIETRPSGVTGPHA
jgi:hypothetical protein